VQLGLPIDISMLSDPFAGFFCGKLLIMEQADIQPGVASVQHIHMEGHRLMSLLIK